MVLLHGGVRTPEGSRLPSVRACVFLLWYSFWRWLVGLLSKTKKKRKKKEEIIAVVNSVEVDAEGLHNLHSKADIGDTDFDFDSDSQSPLSQDDSMETADSTSFDCKIGLTLLYF